MPESFLSMLDLIIQCLIKVGACLSEKLEPFRKSRIDLKPAVNGLWTIPSFYFFTAFPPLCFHCLFMEERASLVIHCDSVNVDANICSLLTTLAQLNLVQWETHVKQTSFEPAWFKISATTSWKLEISQFTNIDLKFGVVGVRVIHNTIFDCNTLCYIFVENLSITCWSQPCSSVS